MACERLAPNNPHGQVTLWRLTQLVAAAAVALAPTAYFGVWIAPLSLWIFCLFATIVARGYRWVLATLLLGLTLLSTLCLLPARSGVRPPALLNGCCSNLGELATAVVIYEEAHGHYPPPFLPDEAGQPAHSWRVLLLPYLDEADLYRQYQFDEPWNSPANLALPMPHAYQCPVDPGDGNVLENTTCYQAIVGPHTMWPPEGKRRRGDLARPHEEIVLLVESRTSRRHWLDPRSPDLSDMLADPKFLADDHHARIAPLAMANGDTSRVPSSISRLELQDKLQIIEEKRDRKPIDTGR